MKSDTVNKTAIQFSLSDLPADYPYRYTLNHILMEKMGYEQRTSTIESLVEKLGISKRMLQYYRYARIEDTHYQLTDDRLTIIAQHLAIEPALLLANPKPATE